MATYCVSVTDAIGKPPSGLSLGNFQWLGSYDECQHIENMTTEFAAQYCMALMKLPNPFPKKQLNLVSRIHTMNEWPNE